MREPTLDRMGGFDGGTDAGPPPGLITIDGNGETWTYFSVEAGVVTPASPETSLDWDIAFLNYVVRTNSGTSGAGAGGGKVDVRAYDAIESTDGEGFTLDALIDGGPVGMVNANAELSDWWVYSGPPEHRLDPQDERYILRTAAGSYAKMRIVHFSADQFSILVDALAEEE